MPAQEETPNPPPDFDPLFDEPMDYQPSIAPLTLQIGSDLVPDNSLTQDFENPSDFPFPNDLMNFDFDCNIPDINFSNILTTDHHGNDNQQARTSNLHADHIGTYENTMAEHDYSAPQNFDVSTLEHVNQELPRENHLGDHHTEIVFTEGASLSPTSRILNEYEKLNSYSRWNQSSMVPEAISTPDQYVNPRPVLGRQSIHPVKRSVPPLKWPPSGSSNFGRSHFSEGLHSYQYHPLPTRGYGQYSNTHDQTQNETYKPPSYRPVGSRMVLRQGSVRQSGYISVQQHPRHHKAHGDEGVEHPPAHNDSEDRYMPSQKSRRSSTDYSRHGKSATPKSPGELERIRPKANPNKSWYRPNPTTKGKNTRSAAALRNAKHADRFYKPKWTPHPWPNGWSPKTGAGFEYNEYGELREPFISANRMRQFIECHPDIPAIEGPDKYGTITDPDYGKMVIWIQKVPSDAAQIYPDRTSNLCRFKDCPIPNRTIRVGHIRVALDEKCTIYKDGKKPYNPYLAAGFTHLYCFERFLNLPRICRQGNVIVRADTRDLRHEEKNKMKLEKNVVDKVDKFIEACQSSAELSLEECRQRLYRFFPDYPMLHTEKRPSYSAIYDKTLNYACQRYLNQKRTGKPKDTFAAHMGDLVKYQAREWNTAKTKTKNKTTDPESPRRSERLLAQSQSPMQSPGPSPQRRVSHRQQSFNLYRQDWEAIQEADRLRLNTQLNANSPRQQAVLYENYADISPKNIIATIEDHTGTRKSPRRATHQNTPLDSQLSDIGQVTHILYTPVRLTHHLNSPIRKSPRIATQRSPGAATQDSAKPTTGILKSPGIVRGKKRKASVSFAYERNVYPPTAAAGIQQNEVPYGDPGDPSKIPRMQKAPSSRKRLASHSNESQGTVSKKDYSAYF